MLKIIAYKNNYSVLRYYDRCEGGGGGLSSYLLLAVSDGKSNSMCHLKYI